ncbi:DUF429 domain-containing protein [Candidatus Woesearchaeota archaeon]|nr:DUF429 domain-containing protein [Candidatus Woesearchaeota archaeon]
MRFVGIDLSWTPRRNSGVAVMEGDEFGVRLERLFLVKSDEDVIAAVKEASEDKQVFVAVDAPVVNPGGERRCDGLVELLFGQFAGGVSVKRRGAWSGNRRGEAVVRGLEGLGIAHDPFIRPFERSRKCFEVYPYPAMVVIFGLGETLRYKGGGQDDARKEGFQKFQDHLKDLEDLHVDEEFLEQDVSSLRGGSLDEYEDKLDAIFCAYVAYYAWRSPGRCEVLGNLREGYVLTPVLQREE